MRSIVPWEIILKYLLKCEGCSHFCEILYTDYLQSTHIFSVSVAGVILESPAHPVTEGDSLTLHCLSKYSTPPKLIADFYKDGSLIQNQTTEMIISNVLKSHEGFYYCKHPERGESPKSWISVRGVSNESCCTRKLIYFFICLDLHMKSSFPKHDKRQI